MATETSIPPIPYKTPMTKQDGSVTETWGTWFRQVFTRIGGNNALSNTDLATLPALDVTLLEGRVDALEATDTTQTSNIATNTASIASLQAIYNDLLQGPTL